MSMDNNYNQMFAQKTKSLTIAIINELSDISYSDKISNIRNRFSDLFHPQQATIEQCAEPDLSKKSTLKSALL